ncbi:hypothetical protein H8E88_26120 [candidate division KSB1 bacterium]|nr:hypothetical protein [candidate division KSB1 bacterium]MBL7095668.1 hypothetical protein [candidate division KSB1 bacterium]
MPTSKTEGTEISVGLGLLNINQFDLKEQEIEKYFNHTLTHEKYREYVKNYDKNKNDYDRVFYVGQKIRDRYSFFEHLSSLNWTGPNKQASTISVPKDIIAANIPISIKVKSNVVYNLSPFNIFVSIPSAMQLAKNSPNWFIEQAYDEINKVYLYVKNQDQGSFPDDIYEFEKKAKKEDRKRIKNIIAKFSTKQKNDFYGLYVTMCHKVASNSAEIFNTKLETSLNSNLRSSTIELLAKTFFRVNAVEYIFCGIDKTKDFAVVVPDLTEWKRMWKIIRVNAAPDLSREQSVVNISVECEGNKKRYTFDYHVEIRWSHGKFCGSPEGKLYKQFSWLNVPFYRPLI